MELQVNDRLYGWTVSRIRYIPEFEGQLIEMEHDCTGARLVWAKNSDENKLFSVGFRTLPEDNTGVFHILEHSVLCGSDKYPVKEPFVELLKTSMNTFLNAMTYSDKTLYPVSSRNEQDYLNLAGVYLDAVFCPKILTDPNIFYQEGWHIETAASSAGITGVYKGVVFNEMKGAMSDVDQLAERTMNKLLFPDTCYGYNSGGDPDAIPDLTYEAFIAKYKRFYHPSNSYFYLDGDIPLDKTLAMIESYLADYDRLEDVPQLELQSPVCCDKVVRFAASSPDDRAMVVFGRIAGTWADRDKLLALSVLTEQIADNNDSLLKRAVLSSGLAEDMEIYISDGIAQPYLMIVFRGVDPDRAQEDGDRLIGIVKETAEQIIREGIPSEDLEASVNQCDFRFRQYPEPQGLYRANAAYAAWLYGGDPALYLRSSEAIAYLRRMIELGKARRADNSDSAHTSEAIPAMEDLAAEYLSDTSLFTRLTLLPSTLLGSEQAAEEAARVKRELGAMSEDELAELIRLNENLRLWQETPDSEEALATIPQINPADISRIPELIPTEASYFSADPAGAASPVRLQDGVTVLTHRIPTQGIVYLNVYFPLTDLSLDELPAAALVSEFYKDLPTENYTVSQLQNEIKRYVGSLSFGVDINSPDRDNTVCTPFLRARAAVLRENLEHAEDLIIEIMTRTLFTDKSLMRELITQIDEEDKRNAVSSGHRLAIYAARSRFTASGAASEAVNGLTFTHYMHKMADQDAGVNQTDSAASAGMESRADNGARDKLDSFIEFAQALIARTVVRSGAVISVTASEPVDTGRFIGMLQPGAARPASVSYTGSLPTRLGITIPASVSHSVQAYDLAMMGIRPAGSLSVAANILSLAFLWNEIRVKGGAYGASFSASRAGSLFGYSYRDPSPDRSLGIFGQAADFLDMFAGSLAAGNTDDECEPQSADDSADEQTCIDRQSAESVLGGFIISTIASTEPLLSPGAKGRSADDFWMSGFTDEDRIRVRSEILDTTPSDLLGWCETFRRLAAEGSVCVIGPRPALETCPDLEIIDI